MKRIMLVFVVALFAPLAFGQAVTRNCVTLLCSLVSDPFPALPTTQAVNCRLFDGATLVVTTPVAGPAGAVYCSFPNRNYTAGLHNLTARGVDAANVETGPSNTVALTSTAPAPVLPPPTNLRLLP